MIEIICGKCNCIMKNDQDTSRGYITFKCDNCNISVFSPNLIEYLKARESQR